MADSDPKKLNLLVKREDGSVWTLSGSDELPNNVVTTDTDQTISATKTFGKLPKSTAEPADDTELVTKKYVDAKVKAGTSTAPANMVTTDTVQTITGAKTFNTVPKSAAVPADNEDLVNKKYVDGLQGNSVTLNTAQTITAEKTFSALPKSTVEPADDAHLVNKKYVDAKVGGGAPENMVTTDTVQDIRESKRFYKLPTALEGALPTTLDTLVTKRYVDSATTTNSGYTLKFSGTVEAVGNRIGFYNLKLFLATGEQLRPRYYPRDKHCGREPHVYTLWTLDPAWTSDKPEETKTEREIEIHQRTPQEFLCKMRSGQSFGQGGHKVVEPYNFDFDGFLVEGDTLDEKAILQFEFEGSMPPITKVELTTNTGTHRGKSLHIESFVTGGSNKVEYILDLTHYTDSQATGIPLNPAFKPEPYYLNRYDEQEVFGVKHFRTLPILEKPTDTFGTSNGNNPPAMADFYNSVAVPLPPKQAIIIGSRPDKTNIGDKPPYKYDWTLTVSLGNMTLKRRNPNTLAIEELYLKCQGPTTKNGIMGVLTTNKPDNYPNAIEEKDQAAMDKYQLEAGECYCKLGYYENLQGHNENEDTYLQYEKPGSNKLKELFQAKKQWYNATNREYNWRDDGGPKLMVALYIYDSTLVSWTIDKNVTRDPGDTFKVWGDKGLKAYSSYYLANANFAADMPDINLKTVNVIAAIDALDARIKKLEEAAPKP